MKKYPSISKNLICEIYKIPRSTLYYKPRKILQDTILKTKIKINKIFNPYYGYRRHSYSLGMNKKKVLRVVQLYELYGLTRIKKKFYKPQDRGLANMGVKNIKKEFDINGSNQVWSSDFTHIYYKGYRLFLATIIDDFSKKIVGYSIGHFHSKELILSALKNALKNNKVPLILHSDQGSEYRSYEYFEALKKYNISASMSKKSSPWENGGQESFYGKLKFELGNLNRFNNIGEVIEAIHLHIYYYNNYRIHTSIKTSPVNFEILHS